MADSSSSTTTTTKPPVKPSPSATPSLTTDSKDQDKQKALAEKKKKRRDRRKKKAKRAKKNEPKTKVIVRRLPPNLPEHIFMNTVQQWTTDELVDFKTYIPGKLSTSKAKESVFSRAYFHMKTVDAVIAFHQGFDGHIFMDSRGNESRAVVEFAPYQGIPKEHKTPDARQGTIDEDPDYLQFLESLKTEQSKTTETTDLTDSGTQIERLENKLALVAAQTLAQEQANKPKTTPLLEHLRAQKAAKLAKSAKKKAAKTTLLKKKATPDGQLTPEKPKNGDEKKSRSKKKKEKAKSSGEPSDPTKKTTQPTTTSEKKEGTKPKRSRNRDKKPKDSKPGDKSPAIKILGRSQDTTTRAT